jgi:hypothetical protein
LILLLPLRWINVDYRVVVVGTLVFVGCCSVVVSDCYSVRICCSFGMVMPSLHCGVHDLRYVLRFVALHSLRLRLLSRLLLLFVVGFRLLLFVPLLVRCCFRYVVVVVDSYLRSD